MRPFILVLLLASALSDPAAAQLQLQGAVPPESGAATAPSGREAGRKALPAMRTPALDSVAGRDLLQDGSDGAMRIERKGGDLRVSRLVLRGHRSDSIGDACRLEVFEGVALQPAGTSQGLSRFKVDLPMCAFTLDVLEGAVVARGQVCSIATAACDIDPSGIWGPAGSSIRGEQIAQIERDRRTAEDRARTYFRALMASTTDKARIRQIAADQAGFSSRRTEACEAYARESVHGFCAARLTEARAIALRTELDAAQPPAAKKSRGRVSPASR